MQHHRLKIRPPVHACAFRANNKVIRVMKGAHISLPAFLFSLTSHFDLLVFLSLCVHMVPMHWPHPMFFFSS